MKMSLFPMKRVLKFLVRLSLALLILGFLIMLLVFYEGDPFAFGAPKDQKLIDIFNREQNSFSRLKNMADEDSLLQASFALSSLNTSRLSSERKLEYKALLQLIKPKVIVVPSYNHTVRFIFSTGSLSALGGGWLKGIEYIPNDITRQGVVVPSLDNIENSAPGVYLRVCLGMKPDLVAGSKFSYEQATR